MRRLLLVLFIVYAVESITPKKNENGGAIKKASILAYPKKSNKVLHKSLKLLNRRYEKTTSGVLPTKRPFLDREYTVFPNNLPKKPPIDVPSSPYFPVDPHDEPKLRVKKVLPDFWNNNRKKRSAALASNLDPTPTSGIDLTTNAPKNTEGVATQKSTRRGNAKRKSHRKRNSKSKRKSGSKSGGKKKSGHKSHKKTSKGKNTKKGKISRRLIAAKDELIENYPYVVSIQKDGEHWCSGAILNQRLVATTANCVWKSSTMSRLKIRAGSRHVESGGQVVRIAQVMKHPGWSIRKFPDHDLALLFTDENIKFSHKCHAVDLPNRWMMPVFEDAWVASWGSVRRDGIYERQGMTLQVYYARVMDRQKCNNITTRFGVVVTDSFICLEQTGRRAPCTRDTGAPAVSDGVLWGLASWGIRKLCGTERFPSMFSYIGSESNMDFIINATHLMMSEQRLSPFLDRFSFRSRDDELVEVSNITSRKKVEVIQL